MGRSIGRLDERMLQDLAKFGPSGLKNTDKYSRGSIIKIFKDKGALQFNVDEELGQVIDNYRGVLGEQLYAEMKGALLNVDQKVRRNLLQQLVIKEKNNPAVQALVTHAVFGKMTAGALESNNIVGVYVNRTMVVGSTLNQFDDYMKVINASGINDELKKFLGQKIGLVSSELAIDMGTTYSNPYFLSKLQNISDLVNISILRRRG